MGAITKKELKKVFIETLEPFARATQKDFKRIDKRFDGVDERLEGIQGQVAGIEIRLDKVESEIAALRQSVNLLVTKFDELISLYRKQEQELTMLAGQMRRLEERVGRLESKQAE